MLTAESPLSFFTALEAGGSPPSFSFLITPSFLITALEGEEVAPNALSTPRHVSPPTALVGEGEGLA